MKRWLRRGATAVGGTAAGAAAATIVAERRWERATARETAQLEDLAASGGAPPATFTTEQLAGLPDPVARYLGFALTPGQPLVRSAHIRWAGAFRMRPGGAWRPFTAVQHYTVRPPGFVWDATIQAAPFLPVRVRDAYIAGEGSMVGKLAALVPVVEQRGTPELAAGALSRYLGETMWLPTALLPRAGVSWSAIDDRAARATLADGSTVVSADFHFGERGEPTGVTTTRWRDVKGHAVETPFAAYVRGDWRRMSGMMIPSSGEAEWTLPEGPFAYWRGRVVDARYDLDW